MQLSDSEKLERWEIANKLRNIHPGVLQRISNGDVASYTGGFVDAGQLNYNAVLGFESKWSKFISIEMLREIVNYVENK